MYDKIFYNTILNKTLKVTTFPNIKNEFYRREDYMKNLKRLLALLICLTVILPVCPALTVFAATSGTCGSNVTWELDDSGTLTISGAGEMKDYSSSSAAPWYSVRESVFSVAIKDGITYIGKYAFSDCESLQNISIPESVTSIGNYAFDNCAALLNVTIPDSVTSLGYGVFYNCTALTDASLGNGITNVPLTAFYGCSSLVNISIGNSVTSIDMSAFAGCTALTNIVLPDSLILIDKRAFENSSSLSDIVIPDNVTSIGYAAFYGCSALKSVSIGNSVTSIDEYAFHNCSSLTSIIFSSSVTSIGDYAFSECLSLAILIIPNSVTSIGRNAFSNCTSLKNIEIPNSLTSIGNYAFSYCSALTSVTIPESVISLGSYAFNHCTALTKATISENLSDIKEYTFADCTALKSITVPDSVTSIAKNAFGGCSSLISVSIGNGVASIGSRAFSGCSALTDIIIPDNVTSIGDDAFAYCSSLENVVLGNGVTSLNGFDFSYNNTLKSIVIGNAVTAIEQNAFRECTALSDVTIGSGVASIGKYAFSGCTALTDITIPDNVTSVAQYAFYECDSLVNVTIGNGLKSLTGFYFSGNTNLTNVSIGNGVTSVSGFSGCTSLTNVSIGNGVTTIGSNAFYGCSSLANINIPEGVLTIGSYAFSGCSALTGITVPDSVTSIGKLAFSDCTALTNVVIGENVSEIQEYAFYECTALQSINIPKNTQSIGNYAFYNCSALREVSIDDGEKNLAESYSFYDCSILSHIGVSAFSGCTSLEKINIPESVTSVSGAAFGGCNALTDVYISDLTSYLNIKFTAVTSNPVYFAKNLYIDGEKVENLVIPDGITEIMEYAFYGLECIKSVTISDTVTEIGNNAFAGCSDLTSISMPDGVTSIGKQAFADCTSLVSVIVPDSVTALGEYAFSGCTSILFATVGNGVTTVGKYAFKGCTSLKTVTLTDCKTISEYAFYECCALESIKLSETLRSIGKYAFDGCSALTDVYYAGEWRSNISISAYNDYITSATWHYNSSVTSSAASAAPSTVIGSVIYISANGGQDIIYNGNTGSYSESEFELNVNVSGLRLDGDYSDETAMKNAVVTITLPDGVCFYEDKSVKARRYEFETLYSVPRISETVYLQSPGVGEFEIVIRASADNVTSKKYTHTLSIAEDIFELNKYRAEWFLESEVRTTSESIFYGDLSDTPSRIIYKAGMENNLGDAAAAWSTFMNTLDMIDSPSAILDYAFEEKDIYEAIIMSLFECSVDYSAASILTNEVVKETNSLVSTAAKEMKNMYNVDMYDTLYENLSDDQKDYLAEIIETAYGDFHPTASLISDFTGYIKTASGYVKDFQSLCENIATYGNVRQLTGSMKEVMRDMYNNCPSDNSALKAALLDCISVMDDSELAFAADMSTLVGSVVGKDIVVYCIDEFWGDMKKAFCSAHPAAFTFMAAYIGGKTIANTIFNADDIEEQYCKIAAINEVWDLAESVYIKERNSFSSEDTDETAQIYNSMIDVMFNMLDVDCEYAEKYANAIDDAWAQKILDVFGDSTIEDWNAGVESLKATYSDIHKSELTNWIWSLETDFPSRFEDYEYLTELTTSEITKKLNINCPVDVYVLNKNGSILGYVKDNVPYCVEGAGITIGVCGDSKTIYLYDDEYVIRYIGNDEGTMDITVTEYDSSGDEARAVYFYDIALSDGLIYTSTENGETLVSDAYYLMAEDGEEILPDYDSLNADSDAAYTASITRGYFTSSMAVETELNAGDKAEIAAYIPEGYKFVGWTSDAGYDIFADAESVTTTITMPDCDVNITAEVEETAALKIASAESGVIEVQALNCEDLTGKIYISVYDADGVHKATVTAAISESITVTELEFESGDIIKAFLWDENMQPQIAFAQRLAS